MAAEPRTDSASQQGPLRVLVVDPNTTARTRVQTALGDGYAVTFADSKEDAMGALRQRLPDLVVSEIDLPTESGLSLCEHVRSLPDGVRLPIMLLTGRAAIQDKVAGFQAGADDYVVKPLDPRLFYARVRLLCRIKSVQQHAEPRF
ncbi:MAG TPA: response regulator transcription factor [Ktedonobacterales bacterium]|nr:response regulator transcription factor [Ktedonobacterales bacterium]